MKLSTKGRYALRIMVDIAMQDSSRNISLKDIACRQQMSIKYLEQVIQKLCKANLLVSHKGKFGGYQLAFPVEEYNALMIIEACEEHMQCVPCIHDETYCSKKTECRAQKVWIGLQTVIDDYLKNISLLSLIENNVG